MKTRFTSTFLLLVATTRLVLKALRSDSQIACLFCTGIFPEASRAPGVSTNHRATANMETHYSTARQLVIIAKPRPGQPYCQLATAFQECWCRQSILHHCLKALRAFSDERHRFGILQELAFAADNQTVKADLMLPADRYYQASEQKGADIRFPYITATLVSSIACCPGQEYRHYRCLLEAPFHTNSNAVRAAHPPLYKDCDDRCITVGVIDITDLEKLRYCFLNMPIWCVKCGLRSYDPERTTTAEKHGGELSEWEMEDYKPASGESIACRLEFDSDGDLETVREARDVEALEMLQAYSLIDIATLAGKFRCLDETDMRASTTVNEVKDMLLTMGSAQIAGHPKPGDYLSNQRRIPPKSLCT